jgi:hypothetical protein
MYTETKKRSSKKLHSNKWSHYLEPLKRHMGSIFCQPLWSALIYAREKPLPNSLRHVLKMLHIVKLSFRRQQSEHAVYLRNIRLEPENNVGLVIS